MPWQAIRSEKEYEAALAEVSAYFSEDLEPGSADADCFERLVEGIRAWEARSSDGCRSDGCRGEDIRLAA